MHRPAYAAEFLGTFVLVLGGCGSAILAGDRIGFLGVAFAFGLSLLAMACAVEHLSSQPLASAGRNDILIRERERERDESSRTK